MYTLHVQYPFVILVNYLILLQYEFVNTQADVIVITFLRELELNLWTEPRTEPKSLLTILVPCLKLPTA